MVFYFAALVVTTVLNLFAVVRMIGFRVYRKLPIMVVFLGFQLAQFVFLIVTTRSMQSRIYQQVYDVTEPLNWLLYVMIVREMYTRVFSEYPGIASLARWSTYTAAGLAALLCLALGKISPVEHWQGARVFSYIETWERFVSFALAAFIVMMLFLLSRYPIKLDFNIASSIVVFTIYFAGSFAFLEIGKPATSTALQLQTGGLLFLSAVCFAAWGIALKHSSESTQVQVRINLLPYEEQRLLDQLALIDNMLLKSARH